MIWPGTLFDCGIVREDDGEPRIFVQAGLGHIIGLRINETVKRGLPIHPIFQLQGKTERISVLTETELTKCKLVELHWFQYIIRLYGFSQFTQVKRP